MIYRYLLVILLSLLTSVSCGLATKEQDNRAYYDPTPVELQQGTAFAAPKYWGVNIRRSKSLRVAFIGGSQTRQGHYIRAFYEAMNETITKMKSNWNFAIYNEGMSGSAPKIRSYKFFGSNASEWPNVIGIEPCLNCAHKKKIVYHGCSTDIDNLKYFINREYSQRGLDVPSYFFIEFFRASEHLWELSSLSRNWDLLPRKALPINASKANELTFDGRDREVYTRGTMYAPFMMDFARFYGMPVLSEADVLYPSYVRFFLTHTDNERWPYTMEGRHTSYEGSALVGKHILRPFFLDQMLPRESDKLYDKSPQFGPYPVDLRMFRASQYKEEHIISK